MSNSNKWFLTNIDRNRPAATLNGPSGYKLILEKNEGEVINCGIGRTNNVATYHAITFYDKFKNIVVLSFNLTKTTVIIKSTDKQCPELSLATTSFSDTFRELSLIFAR